MALELDPRYVFRDFKADGNPASGLHNPLKPEIRALFYEWWQTIIALVADAGDLELPNLLISFTVTGGTANDIQATPDLPLPSEGGKAVFSILTTAANTGPVTINGKPLRTNSGNEIPAGGLSADGVYLFLDNGEEYRLLSDYASASILSAAENAVLAAEDAAERAESFAAGVQYPVSYGLPQTLSAAQKQQARNNIISDENVLITVGAGGDFSNLNDAIEHASTYSLQKYSPNGLSVEVRFLSGFVMAEQLFVSGLNLGFIRLTSVDAVVPVNEAAITEAFAPLDALVPIMGGKDGAVLPLINVLFEYSSNTTAKDGIAVTNSAKVMFAPSATDSDVPVSGVRNSRRGLNILYGAEAICEIPGSTQGGGGGGSGISVGVDFSGTLYRALQIQHGGRATLLRSNFSNCAGDNAVYVIWNSQADIWQSDITGHTGSNAAVHVRDGSVLCARECDASGAANRGFHALHAAVLDARSAIANDCGTYGFLANGASFIDVTQGQANDAGTAGVWASNCSTIEFENGSAQRAGGTAGVGAVNASTVNANAVNVSNSGTAAGFRVDNMSRISAYSSIANGCTIGFDITSANAAIQGSTANNCGIGLLATRGSVVNARSATFQNASSYGIECLESSSVNAQEANTSGAGTFGFRVIRGGHINAGASTGTTSKTVNQIDANGVIYK